MTDRIDCLDCLLLETRLIAASARESIRLHEVERLRERVAKLERDLDAATAPRRHWLRITCERCRTDLELSATLAMAGGLGELALLRAAQALGWWLCNATYEELGGSARVLYQGLGDKDICPSCDAALNLTPKGARPAPLDPVP